MLVAFERAILVVSTLNLHFSAGANKVCILSILPYKNNRFYIDKMMYCVNITVRYIVTVHGAFS